MDTFRHPSSSRVEYSNAALYLHFFSTLSWRIFHRKLYLVFLSVKLYSHGTVFNLEYADDIVLLSDKLINAR